MYGINTKNTFVCIQCILILVYNTMNNTPAQFANKSQNHKNKKKAFKSLYKTFSLLTLNNYCEFIITATKKFYFKWLIHVHFHSKTKLSVQTDCIYSKKSYDMKNLKNRKCVTFLSSTCYHTCAYLLIIQ